MPIIKVGGLAGHAEYVTRNQLFTLKPEAIEMMIDVLSDRYVCQTAFAWMYAAVP
jgi:hypothetical protein